MALRKDSTVEEMGAEAVRTNRRLPPKLAWNQNDKEAAFMWNDSSVARIPTLSYDSSSYNWGFLIWFDAWNFDTGVESAEVYLKLFFFLLLIKQLNSAVNMSNWI